MLRRKKKKEKKQKASLDEVKIDHGAITSPQTAYTNSSTNSIFKTKDMLRPEGSVSALMQEFEFIQDYSVNGVKSVSTDESLYASSQLNYFEYQERILNADLEQMQKKQKEKSLPSISYSIT